MILITIAPELPCGTRKPTPDSPKALCGQPASVARCAPFDGGQYLLLPVCRACTADLAAAYGLLEGQPGDPA